MTEEKKITLILDRKSGDLWQDLDGLHQVCIWGITGLKRNPYKKYVRILKKGEQIGLIWNVTEIKERW